jgi:3-dehydroquinate synthase
VWLHGEAVAAGTIMAADLSQRMGWISEQDVIRVRQIFERAGLPIIAPYMSVEQYLDLMGLDKKVLDGKVRFILLKALGQAVITSAVPADLLRVTLESCSEKH